MILIDPRWANHPGTRLHQSLGPNWWWPGSSSCSFGSHWTCAVDNQFSSSGQSHTCRCVQGLGPCPQQPKDALPQSAGWYVPQDLQTNHTRKQRRMSIRAHLAPKLWYIEIIWGYVYLKRKGTFAEKPLEQISKLGVHVIRYLHRIIDYLFGGND